MSDNVIGFEDFEQMLTYMQQQQDAADESINPIQASIQPGMHALTFAHGYLILWETWDEETYVSSELESYGRGGGTEEMEEDGVSEETIRTDFHNLNAKNRLFGRAYSLIEPRGELGSVHRASLLMPITKEFFTQLLEEIHQP